MLKVRLQNLGSLIIIASLTFSAQSCLKKEKVEPILKFTVFGHLYQTCNLEPVAGLPLILVQGGPNNQIIEKYYVGDLDTCVTDSTGYFVFSYTKKLAIDNLFIMFWVGEVPRIVVWDVPRDTSQSDLDLYLYPSVDIEVSLNVLNPYNEFDTLLLQNYSLEGFKVSGPYKSGYLFRIENAPLLEMSMKDNFYFYSWKHLPDNGYTSSEQFGVEEFCGNTVYLTIDIE